MKSLLICTTSEYEAEIMTILEKILKFAYTPFILSLYPSDHHAWFGMVWPSAGRSIIDCIEIPPG